MIEQEDELLHILIQWFKKHGKSLIITTFIFLSIGLGWFFAKQQNNNRLTQASVLYEELIENLSKQNLQGTQDLAKKLVETYKTTPYGKLGALLLSKQFVEAGKLDLAREQLSWVMEKSEIPGIRQIARLRLARILLSENQYEEALKTINSIDDTTFSPLINQIKGDIQTASGLKQAAKASYSEAIKHWPPHFPGKDLIKLKLQQIQIK